jgi:hypothetical protein
MRVLLVESTPGNAREVTSWLEGAGHDVARCFDAPTSFGCHAVVRREDCSLARPTDLALLVRDLGDHTHTLTEMGAVCAMRHHVPVVEVTEPHGHGLDPVLLGALSAARAAPHLHALDVGGRR